jgi:predicted transcriptional regulator
MGGSDRATGATGDELVQMLGALSNPHRLRIVAVLTQGRTYVSDLARTVGLSRPLVHMHLQRLEAAGLISGSLELSTDGKAQKFFDVAPFSIVLTPATVAESAATLVVEEPKRRNK